MSVAPARIKSRTDKDNTKMAKSKLNLEQQHRYNELMRIAEHGDYMSVAEYDELSRLMKIRGYH